MRSWHGHRATVRRMDRLAAQGVPTHTADGRAPLGALYGRYVRLCREYGWRARVVHALRLPCRRLMRRPR